MKVRKRWIHEGPDNDKGFGSGCGIFEHHVIEALRGGYTIVPPDELTPGQRDQASYYDFVARLPDGRLYALSFEIEPDRGEE